MIKEKRNSSILKFYREGMPRKKLAEKFKISRSRVDQILWKLDPATRSSVVISKIDKELIEFCKKLDLDFHSVEKINLPEDDLKFLIDSGDIEFSKAFLLEKGAKPMAKIVNDDKDKKRSTKRSRALFDFLQSIDSAVFTAESIAEGFSKFCGEKVSVDSIFSYLYTLKKHGYIKSTLRGVYEIGDKIKKNSSLKTHIENVVPLKDISYNVDPVKSTKPKAAKLVNSAQLKKSERIAVENFISKFKSPGKVLIFTTKDIHSFYKDMDPHKLSKAVQNMASLGLVKRGKKLGEYISKKRGDKEEILASSIKEASSASSIKELPSKLESKSSSSEIDYKKLALALIEISAKQK